MLEPVTDVTDVTDNGIYPSHRNHGEPTTCEARDACDGYFPTLCARAPVHADGREIRQGIGYPSQASQASQPNPHPEPLKTGQR